MHKIQFSHANGLPAKTYSYLFQHFKKSEIHYIERMGHGDFLLNGNVENYAAELIAEIERNYTKPVVGIGHSLGGITTLIAAGQRPDLFEQVIVLDPVLLSSRKRWMLYLLKKIGMGDIVGPIKRTLKRKATFESKEVARTYFKPKKLFKNFHPQCFEDYIQHGLIEKGNELELAISPKIEVEVFRSIYLKLPKGLDKVKGVMMYGADSDLLLKEDINWWRKNVPNFKLIKMKGGHLFPFEYPKETVKMIELCL